VLAELIRHFDIRLADGMTEDAYGPVRFDARSSLGCA
jgi:hypothetical protein